MAEFRESEGWIGCLVVLCACGSPASSSGADSGLSPDPGPDAGTEAVFPDLAACDRPLAGRVVVLDIWGRRLPAWKATVTPAGGPPVTVDSMDAFLAGPLPDSLEVVAESTGYRKGSAKFSIDSTSPERSAATVPTGDSSRTAVSLAVVDGCPRITLYLGLDHAWFASGGRPAREGNTLDLLMDGEDFWDAVSVALTSAERDIRGSTWWWQSNFELYRPEGHETMTEEERQKNTVMAILDTSPAVKRILVNRFLPDTASGMAYLNTDADLRGRGLADNDGFEVLLQGNDVPVPLSAPYDAPAPDFSFGRRVAETPEFSGEAFPEGPKVAALSSEFDAASYHQKAFVADGRVAFVIGMNVKSTDWDTHEHRVFESRRMKFASSTEERLRVREKRQLPDLGPRKDYGIRIEGPAARDVDDVLRVRWDQALKDREMYWEHASPFETGPVPAPIPGGIPCQVVATLPPPIAERSILETWAKALANATSYIYIEDQYYRMPILNEIILKTLKERPWVKLIVVTKPVSISDGGKKYTVESDRLFRNAVPDQYLLLKLMSFDAVRRDKPVQGDEQAVFYFQDIDTHSKILIVDDQYLSVGSCNKNNRGLLYEGELNASVLDAAWTREARNRIFRNLVGERLAAQVTDDADANFVLLKTTAEANAKVQAWWEAHGPTLLPEEVEAAATAHRPDGFVYPLEFTDDYLLDVGPDAF